MVDAIAKAASVPGELARRALMLSGDLPRTAEIAMTEGEDGLRDVGFELFTPIFPMLASTAESVEDAVAAFELASVEWKLDGIRIQIHRRGDEVRIYTRNLNEITHALPGLVDVARRLPVEQAVLDGEALWMADDGPAAFQDTVARIDDDATPEGIATFLFDLLHVDGEDLLDAPLEERAARLDAIAGELRIPSVVTSDAAVGATRARRGARRRPRGRRRQGRVVALRRRAAREGVAQGQARSDLRPRCPRRRVGSRPPARLALEPSPRGARPAHRRLRDGRQDLQGDD